MVLTDTWHLYQFDLEKFTELTKKVPVTLGRALKSNYKCESRYIASLLKKENKLNEEEKSNIRYV